MSAYEDKKNSEKVHKYPPILILAMPRQVGYPVWCGNESVEEYLRKKDEEYENMLLSISRNESL